MGDIHPGGNPHYLYDPRQAAKLAIAIGNKLAELDSERQFYNSSSKAVAEQLQKIAKHRPTFRSLSESQHTIVTYHRSLYLIDWLGLKRPINVEPLPGIAPTPRHV